MPNSKRFNSEAPGGGTDVKHATEDGDEGREEGVSFGVELFPQF